jgi:hypothetical protein
MASNKTLTNDPRLDGLDRLCQLCGQPMGQHIAPPYGTKSEEVGAMGVYCPTDPRVQESRNGE